MERIFKIMTLGFLVVLLSCDARRDHDHDGSMEAAEEANDDRFEDNSKEKDADFVAEAVAANYAEIRMAELGLQRSNNAGLKEIAQSLQADHNKALNELKTLAGGKAITVPSTAPDDATKKMENLSDESGDEFDKKWTNELIDRHEDSIDKFEKRFDKTEDAALKEFINKTLPTLRMHKEKLEAFEDRLKNKKNN